MDASYRTLDFFFLTSNASWIFTCLYIYRDLIHVCLAYVRLDKGLPIQQEYLSLSLFFVNLCFPHIIYLLLLLLLFWCLCYERWTWNPGRSFSSAWKHCVPWLLPLFLYDFYAKRVNDRSIYRVLIGVCGRLLDHWSDH